MTDDFRLAGLRGKIAALAAGFVLLIVAQMAYVSAQLFHRHLGEAARSELAAILREKDSQIANWGEERRADIRRLSGWSALAGHARTLAAGGPDRDAIAAEVRREFRRWETSPNFIGFQLLEPRSGRVLVSSDPREEGSLRADHDYFSKGRERVHLQSPLAASAPVLDGDGAVVAVLAGRLNLAPFRKLVTTHGSHRASLRAYVVDTDLAFVAEPAPARPQEAGPPPRQAGDSSFLAPCLAGGSGVTRATDFRQTPVFAGYAWLEAHRQCLVVQMDEAEMEEAAWRLLGIVAMTAAAALAGVLGFALLLGRVLVSPARQLAAAARAFGEGDLTMRLPLKLTLRNDELGVLAREFDRMAEALAEREGALRRSNGELEQFAHVASHDLQEPLRKIIAFGRLLSAEKKSALDDEGVEYLDYMVDAGMRMQQLIEALLSYSRLTTHSRPFEPVALSKAVEAALSDLALAVEESGAAITVGSLPVVEGDPVQLKQLLQNLLSNALKYRLPDRRADIRISAAEDRAAGRLSIIVADNGMGFEPRYAQEIMKPFRRLHPRSRIPGTGMGLAICRKIVERHGGTLVAEGRPGDGATFTVSLPHTPRTIGAPWAAQPG